MKQVNRLHLKGGRREVMVVRSVILRTQAGIHSRQNYLAGSYLGFWGGVYYVQLVFCKQRRDEKLTHAP